MGAKTCCNGVLEDREILILEQEIDARGMEGDQSKKVVEEMRPKKIGRDKKNQIKKKESVLWKWDRVCEGEENIWIGKVI